MEYVYAAMLIHKSGGQVNEESVKKVLEAAGAKVDEARIKALVASLEGVNIDEAIEKSSVVAAPAAAPAPAEAPAEKKEQKPKEDKASEEKAAAGLGALFG